MGGCYGYYESRCSTPVEAEWEIQLKKALAKRNKEALTSAYKAFFNEGNKSGFILEIAKIKGIKKVEDIPKEFPEIEYEVKFDMQLDGNGKEPGLEAILDAFDFPVSKSARFLKDPVNNVAEGINRFYGTDSEERLVVITKAGGLYLKEKSEFLPIEIDSPFQSIVLKRKEKRYPAKMDEVINKIAEVTSENGVGYKGRIRKEKGDIFILDSSDGRIYSHTITRAHLVPAGKHEETEVQRQLEIEYAGYIPGFEGFIENSEKQIAEGMIDLARYNAVLYRSIPLSNGLRMNLMPTVERKFDFVSGIKQPVQSFRKKNSEALLLSSMIKEN